MLNYFAEQLEARQLFSAPGPAVIGFKITPRTPTAQTTSVVFSVTYQDVDGIDPTSLDDRDLRFTGPNGFVRYARAFLSGANPDGTTRIARYKIPPPGDDHLWRSDDNGVYSVRLQGGAVSDLTGVFNTVRVLGSFTANISSGHAVTQGMPAQSPQLLFAATRFVDSRAVDLLIEAEELNL